MKCRKTFIGVLALILIPLWVPRCFGQENMSYQAYLLKSQVIWKRTVDQFPPDTFERGMALYGLLNGTMAERDEKEFHQYYDETTELLEGLIKAGDHVAECRAILSAIYGLELSYNSWKGMFLGPKSAGLIQDAFREAPDNPLVVKLYASSKYYTPEMFGGDVQLAIEEFSRAVMLYEEAGAQTDWIYLDGLAHLGLAYQKSGQLDSALYVFDKALSLEPNFNWVKNSLRPAVLKELDAK